MTYGAFRAKLEEALEEIDAAGRIDPQDQIIPGNGFLKGIVSIVEEAAMEWERSEPQYGHA